MAAKAEQKAGSSAKFKRALDAQNRLERTPGKGAQHKRDLAEGEAAKSGLPALDRKSKGQPKKRD